MADDALFLGFDLSTQQLKGIVVKADLKLVYEAKVDFDADLSKYGIQKGVLQNPAEGEIYAPTAMWLEAFELVLHRLQQQGLKFEKIRAVSGAGMQHGTVFWSKKANNMMNALDPKFSLVEQMTSNDKNGDNAFSHPHSPNWQDASTQKQCELFDKHLGSAQRLAESTGSKAHHRFSGPQILRFREKYPEHYQNTSRISLVSSFVASIFLGQVAPIDIGDVCGMNLWDINQGKWHKELLALAAGGQQGIADLEEKLGPVPEDGGKHLGAISTFWTKRYGFHKGCEVVACTGDNPSTILALPLQASDAMVSLGTSTTFLMSTPEYKPDPSYHFMNHPATAGLYMFMLCYKNGGLAREHIRDAINQLNSTTKGSTSWDAFDVVALGTPILGQNDPSQDQARLGLFFPRPEIVPNVKAGIWRYLWDRASKELTPVESGTEVWPAAAADARAIIESQFLSLRLRSQKLVHPQKHSSGQQLPAQPRRVYLVGGGSNNDAIAKIAGEVLGGVEGVFKLDIGGNACALGSAYKACWAINRKGKETFEDFVGARWKEEDFVKKIAQGYTKGTYERYGDILEGFEAMEQRVLSEAAEGS